MKKNIGLKILAAVLLVILLAYVGIAVFFHSHFFLRTTLNGVDISGKSVEDVKQLISKEIGDYVLTVEEREDKSETIAGVDFDLQPEFGDSIDSLLKEQNMFGWVRSLFQKTTLEEETMVSFDAAALTNRIAALDCMQAGNQTAPENAYISDYTSGAGYEMIPEVMGTTLTAANVEKAVSDAVNNLSEKVSLEGTACYVDPTVFSDDATLTVQLETLNKYAGTKINFEAGSESSVLDGSTISTWLIRGEDGSVTIDDEALTEYVTDLASTYNSAFHKRTLKTSYGSTVTIQGGDYGWKIDKAAEKEQILNDIESGGTISRELNYSQTANSHGENDYGDSYVEINLTAQHLFLYVNGSKIVDTSLVSGNVSKGYNTPVGAYGLTYKERDATLNGENYSTPVSYWMPFCGNVGMHDASWRSSFGGSIYMTSGSHGCVNLPPSAAKTIFGYVDTNFPVLVYELPGTGPANHGAAAAEVVGMINIIGPVTLESETAMNQAQAKYNALADEAKALVSNYATLQDDYNQLAALKAAAGIQ